jgi:ribosome-binding protein aMBF1 (putative translation factor)
MGTSRLYFGGIYSILEYSILGLSLLRSLSGGRDMAKSIKTIYSKRSKELRDLLKQIRTEKGLGQAELAKRIKMTQSIVAKIESGERRLDVVELTRWCDALGISLVDFVTRFDHLRSA